MNCEGKFLTPNHILLHAKMNFGLQNIDNIDVLVQSMLNKNNLDTQLFK